MTTDWHPFGKPIQYRIRETNGHQDGGWLIAWRESEDDVPGIMYLTSDGRYQYAQEGDYLEFYG